LADVHVEVGRPVAACPVVRPTEDWPGATRFPDTAGAELLPLCLAPCWADPVPVRLAVVQVEVGWLAASCPVFRLGAERFPDTAGLELLPICLAACSVAPVRLAEAPAEVGLAV